MQVAYCSVSVRASSSRLERANDPRGGWERKEDEKEGRFQGRGTLLAPNNDREACRKVLKHP